MIEYIYEEDKKRVAAYDDGACIGEITYKESADSWQADHTYVKDEYRGRSIAERLLDGLADQARAQNKKIVPICPYVVLKFEKNSKYDDVKA